MTPAAVLDAVAAAGGVVLEEAGRLVYRAPLGALAPAIRAALRENRDGILEELRRGWRPPPPTPPAGNYARAREAAPLAPGLAAILAAELVRCADCRRLVRRTFRLWPGGLVMWCEQDGTLLAPRDLEAPRYCVRAGLPPDPVQLLTRADWEALKRECPHIWEHNRRPPSRQER